MARKKPMRSKINLELDLPEIFAKAGLRERVIDPDGLATFLQQTIAAAAPVLLTKYLEALEAGLASGDPRAQAAIAEIFRLKPSSGRAINILQQIGVASESMVPANRTGGIGLFDKIVREVEKSDRKAISAPEPTPKQSGEENVDILDAELITDKEQ